MSTLLLNHFNGTDGATTFTDEIPGITWTRLLGDPPCELDTGKAKFGVSSLINSVSSSAYASGFSSPHAGSWTAETFALFTGSIGGGAGSSPSLVLRLDDSSGNYIAGMELYTDAYSQYWVFSLNSGPPITEFYFAQGSVSFAADTWHHLAIVRDSAAGTYAAYLNGVRLVSTSTSTNIHTVSRFVPVGSGDSAYHTLWFDESRLTNEVKYSGSTYTVPTAEFSSAVNLEIFAAEFGHEVSQAALSQNIAPYSSEYDRESGTPDASTTQTMEAFPAEFDREFQSVGVLGPEADTTFEKRYESGSPAMFMTLPITPEGVERDWETSQTQQAVPGGLEFDTEMGSVRIPLQYAQGVLGAEFGYESDSVRLRHFLLGIDRPRRVEAGLRSGNRVIQPQAYRRIDIRRAIQ